MMTTAPTRLTNNMFMCTREFWHTQEFCKSGIPASGLFRVQRFFSLPHSIRPPPPLLEKKQEVYTKTPLLLDTQVDVCRKIPLISPGAYNQKHKKCVLKCANRKLLLHQSSRYPCVICQCSRCFKKFSLYQSSSTKHYDNELSFQSL